jgi:hypothetical protein
MNDCINLTNALKIPTLLLESLTIQSSSIDDDRARLIAHALLENKTVKKLDLSHNKIGDSGARGFAKLLGTPACPLTTLNLANNKIGRVGAGSLGKSLQTNQTLEHLNLRMNHLGDEGGAALLSCLVRSTSPNTGVSTCGLKFLDLASNSLGLETVNIVCALLKRNGKTLTSLDLSCNKLGTVPSITNLMGLTAPGVGVGGQQMQMASGGPKMSVASGSPNVVAPAALGAGNAAGGFATSNILAGRGFDGKTDTDTVGKMLFEAISLNKVRVFLATFLSVHVWIFSDSNSSTLQISISVSRTFLKNISLPLRVSSPKTASKK